MRDPASNDPSRYRPASGSIPEAPGVYRFSDPHGRVIYVGKAKSLRQRLNSYFADLSGLHPRTRQMVTTAAHVRVDGGHHRGRGAAARVQLDQGVRPAVQRPLPGRQDLPGARGHDERGVPAAARLPRAAPQGRALLRARTPTPGPSGRRSTCCCACSRPAPAAPGCSSGTARSGARACWATSTSAPRRASAGSTPTSTATSSRTSATSSPAAPTTWSASSNGEMADGVGRAGVRAGGAAARRHRRAAPGHGDARPSCWATAPTPTSSPSPRTSWRPPCRSSTCAAAGSAASAAG